MAEQLPWTSRPDATAGAAVAMGDRCDGTHWYQRFCGALLRWRIGVVTGAMIIGHVGNVDRFASAAHFARCNGTAPIEASSGERRRHRLNQRGNRQLNYAIHVAAVTQLRYPGNGQDYHQRKRAEGKSSKEAIRALKRQISNSVYRAMVADARCLDPW